MTSYTAMSKRNCLNLVEETVDWNDPRTPSRLSVLEDEVIHQKVFVRFCDKIGSAKKRKPD